MSQDTTESPAARRLSAAIHEMRAEVTATRAALRAVMADDGAAATGLPAPLAELAESASRLVGFADPSATNSAAPGADVDPVSTPPHPMRRITDWAEGILHALPPGSHIVTRRRSEQY
ncbi:hypothetical protein G3576_22255 [Roseomonas stagni]|uniref:Uncharacterized protein n=1 Tax=Falsiroseomonas algicola TaxID=2716930 RepID=A0A6M1LRU5_9PROT|nr:hypothetical protein [Falsiroseomonas algicola]NGM22752.1 hypothetical protein [Falsiroseomonas algicola]